MKTKTLVVAALVGFCMLFAPRLVWSGQYVQPSYGFFDGKFLLFGRADYLDDTLGTRTVDHDQVATTAAIADPIKKFEYTGGVNYLPWAFMRNRLEFTLHDYRGATATLGGLDRNYYSMQVSSTVTF